MAHKKRMQPRVLRFFIALSGCFFAFGAEAQRDTIKDLERFEVDTKYKPILTDAKKVEAYPEPEKSTNTPPKLTYDDIPQFKFKVPPVYRQAPAISLKSDKPEELYGNFFRLGFGNYTTPLAEVYLHSLQSEKYSYGTHFKHLSSQGTNPNTADFSDNLISVYGKKALKKGTLGGRLDYQRNVFHYYGHRTDSIEFNKDQINQIFNDVAGNVHWDNVPEKQKIGTAFDFNFYDFKNLQSNEYDLEGVNNTKVDTKKGLLRIISSVDYTGLKTDTIKFSRLFVNLQPSFKFKFKEIEITAGAKLTVYNDSSGGQFYPNAVVNIQHYVVKDRLKVFGGIDGGLIKNSLKSLSRTNQFLVGNPYIENTFESYRLYAGMTGALKKILDFSIGVSHSGLNNLPLYVIDTLEVTAFNTLYDDGTLFRFFGNLNFNIGQNMKLWVSGGLFNYNMTHQDYAWNLPSFEMSTGLSMVLAKKLNIRFQAYAAGDRFQRILLPSLSSERLAPYIDLNFLADYRYKENISFFLQVNNFTNGRYQQWYNYKVYGLNGLVGVTFSL